MLLEPTLMTPHLARAKVLRSAAINELLAERAAHTLLHLLCFTFLHAGNHM